MSKRIVIKKYPNRKLYNTDTASYISYKDIVEMIKAGHSVMVVDNRTQQDITRFTLTQILFQKERDFLKSLPETTLETAIKQEKGLISNSLSPFGSSAASNEAGPAANLVSPASTANN
jgi:polyhydroxyalkanoate synthesis repressor PhaR